MSQALILNFLEFISVANDQLVTDSLKVAAVHRKRHDGVLRLIRKRLAESGEWGVRNFAETLRTSPQNGQTYPVFTMTQAGYQFLVGKMTEILSQSPPLRRLVWGLYAVLAIYGLPALLHAIAAFFRN